MIKKTSILLISIIVFISIIACKSALLGPEYPITDFKEYQCVVIATVNKAVHDNQRYKPLKTFNVTIKKILKGDLKIGKQINGTAKKENPRAVCPVHLDEKADYLLLLTKSDNGYQLSRFSLPVKKGYKYFDDYISQIEKSISKERSL